MEIEINTEEVLGLMALGMAIDTIRICEYCKNSGRCKSLGEQVCFGFLKRIAATVLKEHEEEPCP